MICVILQMAMRVHLQQQHVSSQHDPPCKLVCTCRHQLPIVVIIMNNSGIYGGDRRQEQLREAAHKGATAAGFGQDPEPTSFVPNAKSVTVCNHL